MVICAAYKCSSRSDRKESGITFHRFPKSKEKTQQWVKNMKVVNWFPANHHRLCSKHFEERYFYRTDLKVKLLNEAVPTIFKELPQYLQIPLSRKRPSERISKTILHPNVPSTSRDEVASDYSPRKRKLRRQLFVEIEKNKQKTRKIRVLNQSLKRSKRKLLSWKQCIKNLEKRNLLSLENCMLMENMSGVHKQLLERKVGKKTKYSPELRKFAITLNFFSPKAYDYVRSSFDTCLPHKSTIGKWYKNINAEPGFTTECLQTLKQYVESSSKPTLCALIVDEISIRKHLEWDGKKYHGYINFGFDFADDSTSLAKEAFVLMLVCINGTWKLPIGYFFTDGLSRQQKASITSQAISLIEDTGAQVKALTCDGAPANITMGTILGCSFQYPNINSTFLHSSRLVSFFVVLVCFFVVSFDPCHVIKLLRNTLGEKMTLVDDSGNFIKWEYILLLVELQECEGLHLANKLRRAHITFFKQKMKVRLAVQVFSRSVADALEYCEKILDLQQFQGCGATIKFIRLINDCFDILNSRSLIAPGYKKALFAKNFEITANFINSVIEYISKLKLIDNQLLIHSRRKTGFIGIIISLSSVLQLYRDTVIETQAIIYLPLYKISQDHLEQFFSSIRSRGGWNNNPTCRQFTGAYKRLLVRAEIRGGLGNCLPLEQIPILMASSRNSVSKPEDIINNSIPLLSEDSEDEQLEQMLQEYNYIANEFVMSEFSEQIVTYIAGFVTRKLQKSIKCETCIAALVGEKHNFLYSLIAQKSHGGLIYPSEDVVRICTKSETYIRMHLENIHTRNFVPTLLNKVTAYFLDCTIFEGLNNHVLENSINHIYYLIRAICMTYANIRLHFIGKMRSQQHDPIRSQLTKLILFKGQ